jgi:[histone H3]-dimethyl-L-lysine9 demethylase
LRNNAEKFAKDRPYVDEGYHCKCGVDDMSRKASERDLSDDNYIYCPSSCNSDMSHFRKHWSRGEPVVVRNVVRFSELSWKPDDIWAAVNGASTDPELAHIRAIDCLSCCQVGFLDLFRYALTDNIIWK